MKKEEQHQFAKRASEALAALKIPELGRDVHGNPYVLASDLPRIPRKFHSTLEACGAHRITERIKQ